MSVKACLAIMAMMITLGGCVLGQGGREAPMESEVAGVAGQALGPLAIARVHVVVPKALKVSEADRFLPSADIVWRGDPLGDRHQQVADIFAAAASVIAGEAATGRGVTLTLEVTRFHGLTEKARYVTGGNYAMRFLMTLTDTASGEVLDGPRALNADIKGSGGARAVAEDLAGRTEKVVVTERITEVLREELARLQALPPA